MSRSRRDRCRLSPSLVLADTQNGASCPGISDARVVQRAIERLAQANLYDERGRRVLISRSEEFLIHGLRYVFPGCVGTADWSSRRLTRPPCRHQRATPRWASAWRWLTACGLAALVISVWRPSS